MVSFYLATLHRFAKTGLFKAQPGLPTGHPIWAVMLLILLKNHVYLHQILFGPWPCMAHEPWSHDAPKPILLVSEARL
jgi:hypothetical protein